MKKASKYILSTLFAALILLPLAAQAEEKWPAISEVWSMVPKADQRDEFFKGLKEHMEFRREAGDPRTWKAYTPMLGDDLNRVGLRFCCFNWADADTYRDWSENNPKVSEHFAKHVGAYVESYGHYFNEISWVNSNVKGSWAQYRYFAVTEFKLQVGQSGAFDAARDEISQISLNQGWATEDHPWMWSRNVGGSPTESIVIPYEKFADMDRDEEGFFNFISKVMGSDEAAKKLFSRLAGAVAEQDFQIWELHEDLSMKEEK